MSTIGKAYKIFGLKGLIAYSRLKTGMTDKVQLPGIKNTLRLRKNSDDIKLFKQIMIHREYWFSSPIEPQFIIDGGANIGLSSVFFATLYPKAEIIAIEPQRDNYLLLCDNTRNYPNIKCMNAGLWHKSTTLEVTDAAVGTTGFMVNETSPDNPNGFKAVGTSEILTLHNRAFIDLYKIDIEGAEKEVLSENAEWLSQTKMMILELHDRKKPGCSHAFFNALHRHNFECHPFGQNFLLFNRDLV
jgi:FkbM family methyltransferase